MKRHTGAQKNKDGHRFLLNDLTERPLLHGRVAERSHDDVTHELFVRLAGAIVANRRPELGRAGPEQ
jgi:hypothetical protein